MNFELGVHLSSTRMILYIYVVVVAVVYFVVANVGENYVADYCPVPSARPS